MRQLLAVVVAAVIVAGCDGGGEVTVPVVGVAARPCVRPTDSLGVGVVVGDDLVATAAHTVEGDLRALSVDGAPATVVALDARIDLALLAVAVDDAPIELTEQPPRRATVHTPSAVIDVDVLRTGTLVVDDTTDGERYERDVHTFAPGVEHGTSGAPLVDGRGRLAGIVVLDNPADDVAYAVTASELSGLLRRAPGHELPAPPGCPE